jgi:hypothetical protein
MVAAIALWFGVLASGGLRDSVQWLVFVVVEAVSLWILALFSYIIWNSRRGPSKVTVTADGVRFTWREGHDEVLDWGQLTRGFVLLDYSVNPTVVRLLPDLLWEMRRRNRPPSPLTKDAFDAILDMAKLHGLSLVTRDLRNPGWGWAPCRSIRMTVKPALG